MGRRLSEGAALVLRAARSLKTREEPVTMMNIQTLCREHIGRQNAGDKVRDVTRRGWLLKRGDEYSFTAKAKEKWTDMIGGDFGDIDTEFEKIEVPKITVSEREVEIIKAISHLNRGGAVANKRLIYELCRQTPLMYELNDMLADLIKKGYIDRIGENYTVTYKALDEVLPESFNKEDMREEIAEMSKQTAMITEDSDYNDFVQACVIAQDRFKEALNHKVALTDEDRQIVMDFLHFGEQVAKAAGVDHSAACRVIERIIA